MGRLLTVVIGPTPAAALAAVALVLAVGCGTDASPETEDYGNLLASPGTCVATKSIVCQDDAECPPGEACEGLILVRSEHPTGWTRPDCFNCHEIRNIHVINRTGLPDEVADLAGVRAIVRTQGVASCAQCHGTNGVEP